jgi:CheY-like chemotaxis protein
VGSTFYFTVWLSVGAARAAAHRVPQKLGQLRVLVVDDNPTAREILQEPLSSLVARVDAVSSGKEALTAIKQRDPAEPYNVVFMDWRMPGMDGLQVARHIKSDETLQHQPAIVLVTAFGREEVREEAERLQLDGFLLKPVTKSMILDSLVNVFAEPGEDPSSPASTTGEDRELLRGARILLAEDNEINQQIAVELLEGVGATVTIANNGRQAVDAMASGPQPPAFDVILMDLQMPEMDGYQATARLRSDDRFAAFPIIAMTAHATVEERQRCLAAGMNDHICKPIDPGVLFETVGRFYKPSPSDHSKAGAASPPRSASGATPAVEAKETSFVSSAAPAALPAIPGLDTNDGLARVGGNRNFYLKLLRQFVDQQAMVPRQIAEAIAHGDDKLAERLAHTVKGVAGSLGASEIQKAAAAVEKAIKSKLAHSELGPVLEPFRGLMETFAGHLSAALVRLTQPSAARVAEQAVDTTELRQVIEVMRSQLNNFDPAAGECLEANRQCFQTLFDARELAAFEQHLSGFAFVEALTLLDAAAKAKLS